MLFAWSNFLARSLPYHAYMYMWYNGNEKKNPQTFQFWRKINGVYWADKIKVKFERNTANAFREKSNNIRMDMASTLIPSP